MRLGNRTFAPGLLPTLAFVPLLALLLWLGNWQWHRAAEKRALFEGFAAGTDATTRLPPPGAPPLARYRHVIVSGRYLPERQFLLDNQVHAEVAGYQVLTPFRLDDGRLLLVNRGWIPVGPDRRQLPELAVGSEPRTLRGRIDELPRAGIPMKAGASETWPRVLNYPERSELEAALAQPLFPQQLLLDAAASDAYVRDWQPPGLPPERHLGYAVQWWGLALTLAVIYLLVNLKKPEAQS